MEIAVLLAAAALIAALGACLGFMLGRDPMDLGAGTSLPRNVSWRQLGSRSGASMFRGGL
jgi:hypothetical protein